MRCDTSIRLEEARGYVEGKMSDAAVTFAKENGERFVRRAEGSAVDSVYLDRSGAGGGRAAGRGVCGGGAAADWHGERAADRDIDRRSR